MDMKDKESEYDSDLNRTMFQEFWRDLDIDFKKKPKKEQLETKSKGMHRQAKSVSRAGGLESSKSSNFMQRQGASSALGMNIPNIGKGHSGLILPSLGGAVKPKQAF